MSKSSGDALFVGWYPTGVILAKGDSFLHPITLSHFKVYDTHDVGNNPLAVLSDLSLDQKGFLLSKFNISHSAFFHFLHEVETLAKAKAADYFPTQIKNFLSSESNNVFYHVTNNGDGEPYSPDNITEKQLIVSGIQSDHLLELQEAITEQDLYPKGILCNTISTLGLLKKISSEDDSTPMIMLEIFEENSLLVIIPPKGKTVFRNIPSGEKAMCEQIKDELGLKDTASSRKLLYSTTIDLSDIGRQVINPIFKEVAATIGMYEVETGQSVSKLFLSNLPPNHNWISELLANDLGMDLLQLDHQSILEQLQLKTSPTLEWDKSDNRFISLFASIGVI